MPHGVTSCNTLQKILVYSEEKEYEKHEASSRSHKPNAPVCFFLLNGQTHYTNLHCRRQLKYPRNLGAN